MHAPRWDRYSVVRDFASTWQLCAISSKEGWRRASCFGSTLLLGHDLQLQSESTTTPNCPKTSRIECLVEKKSKGERNIALISRTKVVRGKQDILGCVLSQLIHYLRSQGKSTLHLALNVSPRSFRFDPHCDLAYLLLSPDFRRRKGRLARNSSMMRKCTT